MSTPNQTQPTIEQQIAALQAQADELKLRQFVGEQLAGDTAGEKDEGLLRVIGRAMEDRLAEARAAGRTGWWAPEVSDADLLQRLQAQTAGGQYLDAAIYAGMLHARRLMA